MKILVLTSLIFFLADTSWGQNSLSLSTPMIWGSVKLVDNWTPSTAPNYKKHRPGSAFSYGIDIDYAFRPKSIIKNKDIFLDIGAGYFFQRFDVVRPFNYNSMIDIIFYTDHYSYLCVHGNVGLTLKHTFNSEKYYVTYNATYRVLRSFQQNYTPTYNTGTEGFFTQTNRRQMNFGKILSLAVVLNGRLGKRFTIGASVIVPVYIRWRNDAIFNDDPATLYKPELSLGTSLSVSYHFKRKQSP